MSILLLGRRERQIRFVTTAGIGQTITPSITLRAGCPYTPTWDFGDGTSATGISVSRTYADAGPHTVTLRIPQIDHWLTGVDFSGDLISGDLLAALARCRSLTSITAHTNAALNSAQSPALLASWWAGLTYLAISFTGVAIVGPASDLPRNLTYLQLNQTSCVITGLTSDLPAGLTTLYLFATACAITGPASGLPPGLVTMSLRSSSSVIVGPASDLPTSLTTLSLYETASTITAGSGTIKAKGLQSLLLYSCAYTAAQLDGLLQYLYEQRAQFTYATPVLQIGGTNPDPNGIYQNATPPTTGLEYAYKLVNDPDAEGFKKWSIAY